MTAETVTAQIRALIEEELGEFRAFADVPAAEIEEMAARLTRALAPFLGASGVASPARRTAA